MGTNNTNKKNTEEAGKLIYPELSYKITGFCFDVHNEVGHFAREAQYCASLESKFKQVGLAYMREYPIEKTGNRIDFLIDDKIIIEVKAKDVLTRVDYYQIQRYLQATDKRLGLLINFRSKYLRPKRIVRIDSDMRSKFLSVRLN